MAEKPNTIAKNPWKLQERFYNAHIQDSSLVSGGTLNELSYMTRLFAQTKQEKQPRFVGFSPETKAKRRLKKAGEDPNEFVLFVGLKGPIPENLNLPDEFDGVKVIAAPNQSPIVPL